MGEVFQARDTRLNRDVAIKVLPAALARNGAADLMPVLAGATPHEYAGGEPPDRLAPEQKAAMRRLQAAMQAVATELDIGAEVLATRRDLTALVRGSRNAAPLRGWRRQVVGEALLAVL